jgi:hypothetical protein
MIRSLSESRPLSGRAIVPHVAAIILFVIGAGLAMAFLSSLWGGSSRGWLVVILVAFVCTGIWLGSA